MRMVIDPRKSIYENAAVYFEKAKRLRKKATDTAKAMEQTKKEIESAEKNAVEAEKTQTPKIKKKPEWFERFRWFFSSDGFLAIGGKNADQNEQVVKKYFEQNDLFFHADIRGGSVVILKNGVSATSRTLEEAAQFAATFSNAWKGGLATIHVCAAGKEQVSKSAPAGEYLEKGSFIIKGEKKQFKNVPLKLIIGKSEAGIACVPERSGTERFSICFELAPGDKEKEEVAEQLARALDVRKEDIIVFIPSGMSVFKKLK